MHVLFIIDPLPSLAAYKDTSVAMMRALIAQNHRVSVCLQPELYIDEGRVKTHAQPIHIAADADLHNSNWWQENEAPMDVELNHFSAVIMRKDPPFDMEYFYSSHLLSFAEEQGAKVFNTGSALRNHPEKLAITEFSFEKVNDKLFAFTIATDDANSCRLYVSERSREVTKDAE